MAKKKSTQARRKPRQNRSGTRKRGANKRTSWFSFRVILHVTLILLLGLAAWVLWLDQKVQARFEGKTWSVPATVYARPLELFTGQQIQVSHVSHALDQLGYRRVSALSGQGEYSVAKGRIHLFTRGFQFVDGTEASQKVALHFSASQLRRLEDLETKKARSIIRLEPLEIGKIYPDNREDRHLITLQDAPPFLINTLLATEDRHFFSHYGVDPRGVLRAIWSNVRHGKLREGASTLTQQLAKNVFLTPERTLRRKLNELIIAFILEARYSKEAILEAYLNEVFLSQDNSRAIHGFALAADYFFHAPLKELRDDQLALLVGMVKGPSVYNPHRHPDRALARRNVVLKTLQNTNQISAQDYESFSQRPLDVRARRSLSRDRYPDFTALVRQELFDQYADADLREEGLRIFTTLDPDAQEKAQAAVSERIKQFEQAGRSEKNKLQAAVVVADVKSGEIKAIVGGRDAQQTGFNRALSASRHIGSLIKPVIYLTALEKGYSLANSLNDQQIDWPLPDGSVWSPENYEKVFFGDVLLINALAHSYNAATVQLGKEVGLKAIAAKLRQLGVEFDQVYPASLLGALEQTPLAVASLYQSFANDGFRTPLRAIRAVVTTDNQVLNTYALNVEQVTDPQSAYLLKYALSDVVRQGTGRSLVKRLPNALPLAGKTGTTGDLRDSWFAGFDQNTVTVVWLGRDDNKPAGLTGASGALTIWSDLMRGLPIRPLDLSSPQGIEWHWIDPKTGAQTDQACANAQAIPFRAGKAPQTYVSCESTEEKGFLRGLFE